MKLLEKDIHEKQDTVISLRRQLEDIKLINLDMYKKLQVCQLKCLRLVLGLIILCPLLSSSSLLSYTSNISIKGSRFLHNALVCWNCMICHKHFNDEHACIAGV